MSLFNSSSIIVTFSLYLLICSSFCFSFSLDTFISEIKVLFCVSFSSNSLFLLFNSPCISFRLFSIDKVFFSISVTFSCKVLICSSFCFSFSLDTFISEIKVLFCVSFSSNSLFLLFNSPCISFRLFSIDKVFFSISVTFSCKVLICSSFCFSFSLDTFISNPNCFISVFKTVFDSEKLVIAAFNI